MSDASLDGKVALVTGASKGIGRACAIALAAAGARVVLNYRSDEAGAREAADAMDGAGRRAGGRATIFRANVGEEDEVRALFAHAEEAFGGLDLLVNNAGIQRDADLVEMSLCDWQAVIGTNLQGQFLCAREAARLFCRKKPGAKAPRKVRSGTSSSSARYTTGSHGPGTRTMRHPRAAS